MTRKALPATQAAADHYEAHWRTVTLRATARLFKISASTLSRELDRRGWKLNEEDLAWKQRTKTKRGPDMRPRVRRACQETALRNAARAAVLLAGLPLTRANVDSALSRLAHGAGAQP